MRKFVTLLLAVAVLAAVGCAGSSRSEDGVTRIAYIVKAMTDEFWIDMKKGAEEYAAAKLAGEDAVARHPEGGNVVLLEGIAGVSALQQRLDGFKDQVAANPKFKIVASQTANNDRHQAFNVMQNILQSNPDVDVVWAINAGMGQGAVQAIQQSGTTRRIAVYDFDASSDDIAAIRAGTLVGSVAQYPKLQAEGAINAALDAMAGKNLPAHTVTKAELITAANVDTLE